eukprot:15444013-Alexandrium_andersonii.AAC.1
MALWDPFGGALGCSIVDGAQACKSIRVASAWSDNAEGRLSACAGQPACFGGCMCACVRSVS